MAGDKFLSNVYFKLFRENGEIIKWSVKENKFIIFLFFSKVYHGHLTFGAYFFDQGESGSMCLPFHNYWSDQLQINLEYFLNIVESIRRVGVEISNDQYFEIYK